MDKLKPCPFCGSEAEMHTRLDSFDSIAYKKCEIPKTARIVCEKKYPNSAKVYVYRKMLYVPRCTTTNCMGRTTRSFEIEREAEDKWNRRATE